MANLAKFIEAASKEAVTLIRKRLPLVKGNIKLPFLPFLLFVFVQSPHAQRIFNEQRVPHSDFVVMSWGPTPADPKQLQLMKEVGINIAGFARVKDLPVFEKAGMHVFVWVGVVDLLRAYVLPKEEGYLELLLSKPLGRTQYLFAKVLPVFGVIAGMGIVLSFFLPLKIALINGVADLHLSGVLCAGVVTTTLALTLLALLNLAFLFSTETYYAALLAFILFTLVVLPGSIFMYRPDVFQGHAALRDLIMFPGNLLWHSESLPKLTSSSQD